MMVHPFEIELVHDDGSHCRQILLANDVTALRDGWPTLLHALYIFFVSIYVYYIRS